MKNGTAIKLAESMDVKNFCMTAIAEISEKNVSGTIAPKVRHIAIGAPMASRATNTKTIEVIKCPHSLLAFALSLFHYHCLLAQSGQSATIAHRPQRHSKGIL